MEDHKEPTGTFQFVLGNSPNQIVVGSLRPHPKFEDGYWKSPIHYDLDRAQAEGIDITRDLFVSGTWNGRDCITTVPGDANYDCVVDFVDFLVVAENYGRTEGATWPEGDFDWDKQVTFLDFLMMAEAYGSDQLATVAVVPEPSTLPLCFWLWAPALVVRCSRASLMRKAETCWGCSRTTTFD